MSNAMSLKAKIRNISKQKNIPAQVVLQNYMFERLLVRLSASEYKDKFVLKGGMLVAAIVGLDNRATMDMDTTLKNLPLTPEAIRNALEQICGIAYDDGVIFEIGTISPIREDDILLNAGNFPLRSYDFFPKKPAAQSRYAHILDFDVLRLGKKVITNNPKAGSFEFGVVVITEVGKERKNNLELTDVKGKAKETNQKNDLFNVWLKMCRHAATVDNYPFIKVITDEQRAESWGADARDLCDILTIVGSGKPKLALPFYTIEDMIACIAFSRFMRLYYDFRYRRGDNTLLVYLLKSVVGWIYKRNERLYNRFGYSVLSIEKERGTQDGKIEKKRYYLADYKIYRDRFSTDCFSDYFNDLALKTKVGLRDYLKYRTSKASVEELKAQNSYFINGLYGNAENSRGEGRSA